MNADRRVRQLLAVVATLAGLAGPGALQAQVLPRSTLSLAGARKVIAAAEQEAQKIGAPCVVAVVDPGGHLIALERMDDAPMLISVILAEGKARSAALYGKPTKDLEDAINTDRAAAVTAGTVQMQGGTPLHANGQIVGAVGVSADTKDHDQQIAAAAAAAVQ